MPIRSQLTTPSGDSTEVPNRPTQRARIRFFAKSSVLDVSDHCTPTPMVSVSTTSASVASAWPTPAAWLTVATMGTPNCQVVSEHPGEGFGNATTPGINYACRDRRLSPVAIRQIMGRARGRPGLALGPRTGSGTRWRPRCCARSPTPSEIPVSQELSPYL